MWGPVFWAGGAVSAVAEGGTLFVIGTPIGNLDDMSPRVVSALEHVHTCFAEDTRRTGRLVGRLRAAPKLLSLFAHNEQGRIRQILALLEAGNDVAIVSDAGTPTVSDPGARAVQAALEAGFIVSPVPGPSAVSTALSASGLPADRYLFVGFAPRKGVERANWLSDVAGSRVTVVMFEAPGRLANLLAALVETGLGARRLVVCRELTKIHEEIRSGPVAELATVYGEESVKGEVTLVMAGDVGTSDEPPDETEIAAVVHEMVRAGDGRRAIADALRERFGLSRNDAYRMSLVDSDEANG